MEGRPRDPRVVRQGERVEGPNKGSVRVLSSFSREPGARQGKGSDRGSRAFRAEALAGCSTRAGMPPIRAGGAGVASAIIAATRQAGLIDLDPTGSASTRYAQYRRFWE